MHVCPASNWTFVMLQLDLWTQTSSSFNSNKLHPKQITLSASWGRSEGRPAAAHAEQRHNVKTPTGERREVLLRLKVLLLMLMYIKSGKYNQIPKNVLLNLQLERHGGGVDRGPASQKVLCSFLCGVAVFPPCCPLGASASRPPKTRATSCSGSG